MGDVKRYQGVAAWSAIVALALVSVPMAHAAPPAPAASLNNLYRVPNASPRTGQVRTGLPRRGFGGDRALGAVGMVGGTGKAAGSRILAQAGARRSERLAAKYGDLPIAFEPNVGQTNKAVSFLAHGGGYTMYLSGASATFALLQPSKQIKALKGGRAVPQAVMGSSR